MRLKRVEMIGFKSFMDRTVLDFRDGITCVLGPNGCGKSNVVDAVRWVLGEQSAKQLRGEKMEDVIFKGTRRRKPMSSAEVSLVFDNTAQRLNLPYAEVAVTRRVSRAGTSDYFLNKTPCRLKDIRDLFYDTGVGNNAYSVIEQEIVGQVLDPSEDKVRTILEEGSGIVRYKVKRKEALRKLDLTERDLLRVEDIIEEIGRQVRSLARQVGKARRHQRLYGEVKALEFVRAHMKRQQLQAELDTLRDKDQELRAEGSGDDAEASRIESQVSQLRPELDGLEDRRREKAQALSEVESQLNRIEGELLVLQEKIASGQRRREEISAEMERGGSRATQLREEQEQAEVEHAAVVERLREREAGVKAREAAAQEVGATFEQARRELAQAQQMSLGFLRQEADQKQDITAAETKLEALRQQEDRLRQTQGESEQRLQTLREQLTDIESQVEAKHREIDEKQQALVTVESEVKTSDEQLQQCSQLRNAASDELARVESRHEMALKLAEDYEGYRAGAATLLKDEQLKGRVKGAMAERLKVEPDYAAAFELLFGEDADALLVDAVGDARDLAQRLVDEELGLASFVADLGRSSNQPLDDSGVPGRAATDLVQVDAEAQGVLSRWLSRVRVVETSREAVDGVLEYAGRGFSFLSRDGLYLRHDGLVRGGSGARRALSLFGRRDQVEQLAEEVQRRRSLLAEREREEQAHREALRVARERVTEVQRELSESRQAAAALQQQLASRQGMVEREQEEGRRNETQLRQVEAEMQELLAEVESLRLSLGRHGESQEASQRRVEELTSRVAELEAERDRQAEELGEARLALTHDRGVDRELRGRRDRLENMRSELDERLRNLDAEGATLEKNVAQWQEEVRSRREEVDGLYRMRSQRQEDLREVNEIIDGKRNEVEQLREQLRLVHERQKQKADALHEVETQITKVELTLANLEDRIQEKFETTVEEGYQAIEEGQLPSDLVREEDTYQLSQVEEMLNERQQRLDKIGPVNFVALDEYEEKKQRLDFLEQQRDDLLKSKDDLLRAIDTINRTAREMFQTTFEQVRQNFREIFTTLFSGGEADLILHKTDDPLQSDIQVMARPSGKRVDSVSLLSGGERALTAIALLFAVYLIKPSPFCLLDEVDAPLDDMNVGRFVRLLERFSDRTQFIVITHNKLTMEAGNHLYGVTMEESGVSRLVSVSFDELRGEDPIEALEGIAAQREADQANPERRLDPGHAVDKAREMAAEAGAQPEEV